jgi:hypothetical protein
MGTNALWLSRQERVQAEPADGGRTGKYRNVVFQARSCDGSVHWIDRTDILLDEEQAMIDELAHIVFSSKNPAQNGRYALIMKQLISRGVPYAGWLMKRKPRQESIDLFHAG